MILQQKATAYLNRKHLIERLQDGDIVFLYRSKVGIVAYGTVLGDVETKEYGKGDEYEADGEYSKKLSNFANLEAPLTAAQIKQIIEKKYPLRFTMTSLTSEDGELLFRECKRRSGCNFENC